ncbi:hypothetical protein [Paracoccus ravus]|uniref:hypothetical protein n=1 Tax=Paracoccus ravus TaxID=2447760 RepID=UPI00106EB83D|nr:hypothetical protein [Paracoccus ravus]
MKRRLSKKTASAFMEKLLEPVHLGTDKELAAIERRAKAAAKKQAEEEFQRAYMAMRAAGALHEHLNCLRLSKFPRDQQDRANERQAFSAWVEAAARFMCHPAPHVRGIRLKERHLHLGGREQEFKPFIDADKAKLLA